MPRLLLPFYTATYTTTTYTTTATCVQQLSCCLSLNINRKFLPPSLPQYTIRNGRGRFGIPGSDRKPLVLSTYQDAQQHLPYADDSNAVTPMSEENGAIIVPVYYGNLGAFPPEKPINHNN